MCTAEEQTEGLLQMMPLHMIGNERTQHLALILRIVEHLHHQQDFRQSYATRYSKPEVTLTDARSSKKRRRDEGEAIQDPEADNRATKAARMATSYTKAEIDRRGEIYSKKTRLVIMNINQDGKSLLGLPPRIMAEACCKDITDVYARIRKVYPDAFRGRLPDASTVSISLELPRTCDDPGWSRKPFTRGYTPNDVEDILTQLWGTYIKAKPISSIADIPVLTVSLHQDLLNHQGVLAEGLHVDQFNEQLASRVVSETLIVLSETTIENSIAAMLQVQSENKDLKQRVPFLEQKLEGCAEV